MQESDEGSRVVDIAAESPEREETKHGKVGRELHEASEVRFETAQRSMTLRDFFRRCAVPDIAAFPPVADLGPALMRRRAEGRQVLRKYPGRGEERNRPSEEGERRRDQEGRAVVRRLEVECEHAEGQRDKDE